MIISYSIVSDLVPISWDMSMTIVRFLYLFKFYTTVRYSLYILILQGVLFISPFNTTLETSAFETDMKCDNAYL